MSMTYISVDTKNKQSESFLAFVETLPFATIHTTPNNITLKTMADAKAAKTTRHKNVKSLVAFLNK